VTFTGTLKRHRSGFARHHSVAEVEGAGELRRSPQHIVVSLSELSS
jgi:hypothetical protein